MRATATDLELRVKVPIDKHTSKLYSDSFVLRGPITYYALPNDLRNLKDSNEVFKKKLDDFLNMNPDVPRIIYGSNLANNDLETRIS